MNNAGLVLSGGGARTAFQAGVIKAINEWIDSDTCPFSVITGASAGSINAAYLAANADQFNHAVNHMVTMWQTLSSKWVYNSDLISTNRIKTLMNVFNNIRQQDKGANSLLNAMPLAKLLKEQIDVNRIQYCIDEGHLDSLAITATSFEQSLSTTFVQSKKPIFWERVCRKGLQENIKIKHLMASTAIPFLFAPVKIKQQFYGDGSLRNFAPLSPAIRCGAKGLVVIGIREEDHHEPKTKERISFGDIFSKILNTILYDSLDVDNERLSRINHTLSQQTPNNSQLKQVDSVIVRPSIDFCELVEKYDYECPPILRQLLKLIGAKNNGADLKSYLMFEPGYLNAVVDQGYKDAQAYKQRILQIIRGC